ncbi:MAG: nucleotide exchange factor GrpE [Gammaproteobacteria bacterium]|nr:nucleotide exchange factor GrpE [Gammaproteobacteria bacterium]
MANKGQSENLVKETEQSKKVAADKETEHGVDSAETATLEFNIEELQQELREAQTKAETNWEKLLRLQAELENQRKRSQRELENAHKYAIERFVNELLPVKDSLELGAEHTPDQGTAEKLHEGMELTLKMLVQLMEKFNIEEIDPEGKLFDPKFHQAMTLQEDADLATNTVITVMQKGYTLNGRLVRPAMVIVSKRP